MEKENQSSNIPTLSNLGIKGIAALMVILFVLFVAYKFISSAIDKQRSESILEKKAMIDSEAREPLEQCLNNIERGMENSIALGREIFTNSREPDFKARCEAVNMQYSGKKGECSPSTLDEFNTFVQGERDKAEIEKQECYKRYK